MEAIARRVVAMFPSLADLAYIGAGSEVLARQLLTRAENVKKHFTDNQKRAWSGEDLAPFPKKIRLSEQ